MPALDSYIVTLGVKGQDDVLSNMNKIRKEGKKLSGRKTDVVLAAKSSGSAGRKTAVDLAAKSSGSASSGAGRKTAAGLAAKSSGSASSDAGKPAEKEKKTTGMLKEAVKKFASGVQKFGAAATTDAFKEATKKFAGGVQTFGAAAATLDPMATIQSFTSAIGTTLSGIEVFGVGLGRLPEGIAALTNTTLSMAKNSVDMAKQSTLAYHQLADRNSATAYYGNNVKNSGQLSRAEMAGVVATISGSMGVIQEPLADEINKLMSKKDTAALSRVGAGDWESTGTNKGWILQQIMNGVQGMPPSVKQGIQASLLRNNSDIIQDYNTETGQKGTQKNAAGFANRGEDQTAALYSRSLNDRGETKSEISDMETGLNKMQGALLDVGLKFADVITTTTNAVAGLPEEIAKTKKALADFAQTLHVPRAVIPSSLRAGQ